MNVANTSNFNNLSKNNGFTSHYYHKTATTHQQPTYRRLLWWFYSSPGNNTLYLYLLQCMPYALAVVLVLYNSAVFCLLDSKGDACLIFCATCHLLLPPSTSSRWWLSAEDTSAEERRRCALYRRLVHLSSSGGNRLAWYSAPWSATQQLAAVDVHWCPHIIIYFYWAV